MPNGIHQPIVFFVIAFAIAGCGDKKTEDKAEPMPAATGGDQAPANLAPGGETGPRKLSEAKVTMTSGSESHTVVMTSVGDVKADGETIGTLGIRGDLRIDGKTIAILADNNSVTLERQGKASLTLAGAEDGSLRYLDEVFMEWDAEAKLSGHMVKSMANKNEATSVSFEGAQEMRLPMSVALLAVMLNKGARRDTERVFEKIEFLKTTPEMIKADLEAMCSSVKDGKTLEEITKTEGYKTRGVQNVLGAISDLEASKRAEVLAAGLKELGVSDWKCDALDTLLSAK